jgi:hypothetical protein
LLVADHQQHQADRAEQSHQQGCNKHGARQNLAPCPRGTERHRIVHWIAQSLIDPAALGYPTSGLAGAVAAAYRRLFGDRLPARDPTHRASRVYTRREITVVAANISPRK